jgi:hypothetical protein
MSHDIGVFTREAEGILRFLKAIERVDITPSITKEVLVALFQVLQ